MQLLKLACWRAACNDHAMWIRNGEIQLTAPKLSGALAPHFPQLRRTMGSKANTGEPLESYED